MRVQVVAGLLFPRGLRRRLIAMVLLDCLVALGIPIRIFCCFKVALIISQVNYFTSSLASSELSGLIHLTSELD